MTDLPKVALTLVLLRHGEASPSGKAQDHQRVLTKHGVAEAQAAGRHLAARGFKPDFVVASDAARASMTCELALAELGRPVAAEFTRKLYLSGLSALLEWFRDKAGGSRRALVVGHNPHLSDIATTLSAEMVGLDTGALALLKVEATSWEEALAMNGAWELQAVLTPEPR